MQKIINLIALLSGLTSLAVIGGGVYLYKNADVLIEDAREKATQAAVLSKPEDSTIHMKNEFKKRRDLIVNQLSQIQGIKCNIPDGAFYVFPDISYFFDKKDENNKVIKNSNDLSMYLLNDAHVATVAGAAFGTNECIRISYATSTEKITEATQRIKKSLEKLR